MVNKIIVFCSKNKIFWIKNSNDILVLRSEFRITGNLIKITSLHHSSNFFLFLSLEEFLLGSELGFLKTKILKNSGNKILNFLLTKLEVDSFAKKNYYAKIIKKKLRVNKKKNNTVKIWREMVDIISEICHFKFQKKIKFTKMFSDFPSIRKIDKNKKKNFFTMVNLEHFLKGFSENAFFKYSVFKNLWSKGFNLSCGIKFGCTFLAYAGNITDIHAYLSILTLPIQFSNITPKLLIAFGRVGTVTKKFNILVYLNYLCLVKFCSLRWHNFLP